MHILYLHQFFTTREGTGGTRSYEFARHLAGAGHDVTMVTAARNDAIAGSSVHARSRPNPRRYDVDGFAVVEVKGGSPDYVSATAQGYARRIAGFGGFAAAATAAAVKLPRPDVVFATSPALTVAVPGLLASRRHRAPLVFEVRDLWPRAPIEMGALRNPVARALARGLEKAAYRGAAHVVALSPGMVEGVVAAGVDPGRVTLIPNAADLDLFSPDVDPGELGDRFGDDFVCSYFGTMGEANDLDQVVHAATVLADRGERGVTFALMGDGKRRPALEEEVRRRGLPNVVLLPAGDKAAAARLAAASGACLTVFKDVPVLATNSPNKLFDTFAAGRAAIVNTGGWQRELVEANEAGVYVRPGDADDLAAQVLALRDDPELTATMGANARRLAEAQFDRRDLAEQLRVVLEEAAVPADVSYCVVNTNGREYLRACLAAIERVHPPGLERELLVLDNCSDDGSADMVRSEWPQARLIALSQRTGKAENDSTLLRAASGRHCLLLNEDSELLDGSVAALVAALDDDRGAAAAGAQLVSAAGEPKACAWRLPGLGTALATAVFAHRNLVVQSRGSATRRVGWVQSSAMLVRRAAAEQVGYLDPAFFVYSDETDFCKRLHDAGWRVLFVPSARAIHHDQLNTDLGAARRRIVEFHRNRDLYLRKHHGPLTRLAVRALGAWFYLACAVAATVAPGHDPRRYLINVRQEIFPRSGKGIREAADEYNNALGHHGTP